MREFRIHVTLTEGSLKDPRAPSSFEKKEGATEFDVGYMVNFEEVMDPVESKIIGELLMKSLRGLLDKHIAAGLKERGVVLPPGLDRGD
jgi:hypothetical protein